MPITPNSSNARRHFQEWMRAKVDERMQAAIEMLDRAGLEATREMRTGRRYTDRTGNLRSSTGYAVVMDGRIVRGGHFTAVTPKGAEGKKTGEDLVREAAHEIGHGSLALVLVAGMKYAYYVERMGLNVTDSGVQVARQEVDAMARELGFELT